MCLRKNIVGRRRHRGERQHRAGHLAAVADLADGRGTASDAREVNEAEGEVAVGLPDEPDPFGKPVINRRLPGPLEFDVVRIGPVIDAVPGLGDELIAACEKRANWCDHAKLLSMELENVGRDVPSLRPKAFLRADGERGRRVADIDVGEGCASGVPSRRWNVPAWAIRDAV